MPRNMSFMITTDQIIKKTKTVTRRLGWKFLKKGDVIWACEKCQGLKKGEKVKKIVKLLVVDVSFEKLSSITQLECVLEGFPNLSPNEFIDMFCQEMKCISSQVVTRIEFKYMDNTMKHEIYTPSNSTDGNRNTENQLCLSF